MKNTPNKLASIASSMVATVQSTGRHAYTRLPAGLEIVMQRTDRRWRLALAREAPATPSEVEIVVICRDFKVPDEAHIHTCQKTRWHPKSRREITYNVAELTWREVAE